MYNDFVVVGPEGIIAHNGDIGATFSTILEDGLEFISRGDDSGTHRKETSIWDALGMEPQGTSGYISAGQSMGATLGIAKEMNAFTLSDRATWLNYPDKGGLVIICEGHPELFNPYGVIPVSASAHEHINAEGGQAFADWITGPSGQALIAQFGVEDFGEPLFIPDAK
jgi:tungstate transport system substrate-binding protein